MTAYSANQTAVFEDTVPVVNMPIGSKRYHKQLSDALSKLAQIKRQQLALKAQEDEALGLLKEYMGDAQELYSKDGTQLLATWRYHERTQFQTAKFKEAHAKLYAKYSTTQLVRNFLLK